MFRKTILRRLRRKPHSVQSDPIALFSHELRTPLHGLSGMLELLGRSGLPEHQQQLVNAMQQCSHAITSMLNGAIEIPGLYSTRLRASISQFNLVDKLEDTIAMYQGWAATRAKELAYSVCADTPEFVSADEVRLQQVLNNMVSNAIKYGSGGVVMINVSCQQNEPPVLQFRVCDSGIGIAKEVRHPDVENYSSSGMGLDLSRALLKAVGGSMTISANGARCSFTFPIASISKGTGISVARSKLLQRRCVLVIMGKETMESVSCHLQRWDIHFVTQESVSGLRDSSLPHDGIDTVILDLPMAEIGTPQGLETIQRCLPGIPVAVLLPFATKPGDWIESAGVTVIPKPLTRDGLAAWLLACSLSTGDTAD